MDGLMDDDYDPLAPVRYGDDASAAAASEDRDPGYADPDNIVRVWLTDSRLSRVRISPLWHLKVRERTLDDCFAASLAAARVRIAPALDNPAPPDLEGVDFSGLPRFNRSPLLTYRLALQNFQQRWEEALTRAQAAPAPSPPPVSGVSEGVRVRLDAEGHAVGVELEEEWLEGAAVEDIAHRVLDAARKAYAAFGAVPPQPDELADLAREHEILMAGLMAMLTGRDGR